MVRGGRFWCALVRCGARGVGGFVKLGNKRSGGEMGGGGGLGSQVVHPVFDILIGFGAVGWIGVGGDWRRKGDGIDGGGQARGGGARGWIFGRRHGASLLKNKFWTAMDWRR